MIICLGTYETFIRLETLKINLMYIVIQIYIKEKLLIIEKLRQTKKRSSLSHFVHRDPYF